MKVPGDGLRTLQKTPWSVSGTFTLAGPCTLPCAQTLGLSVEMLLPNHSTEASLAVLEDTAMHICPAQSAETQMTP